MINIKTKHLFLFIILNVLLIICISFGINYAYSKLFWSNRVSIHSGVNSNEYIGSEKPDTLTQAYVGQAYKIGTAFEVYKPQDPLLKVVSENHGALELAVASGDEHFSNLAKPRDAIIRKVGEGDLIFSIPSYTDENVRSIIFGNESKVFLELNNSNNILIDTRNLSLNKEGILTVNDVYLNWEGGGVSLSEYLHKLNLRILEANIKIDSLENLIPK
ncbi:MAG: hypothetical protein DRJ15_14470 [Bacteroidetes bacterium]|nr:MAG: hypothetical protein DRJ15_14470 [Bacteroidota bacterium]